MHNIDHHVPIKLTANSKLRELNSERDGHVFTAKLESKIGYWNSYLTTKCEFKLRRQPTVEQCHWLGISQYDGEIYVQSYCN